MRDYDVVIVGGGVVGCAIARRLSFTTARVALVDAADDVGEGASKGNTGIASCGADCPPGSLEAELVTRSSAGWEALCATLDTPFRRIGGLAVAQTADEERGLERLLENARANGCDAEVVAGDGARAIEPMLAPPARAALRVPGDGIVDPLRLTIGYAELAARNGVDVLARLSGHRPPDEPGAHNHVETLRDVLGAGFVVNAAGIEADTISRLAGGEPFSTWPRQGQYWLLDREIGSRFQRSSVAFRPPRAAASTACRRRTGRCCSGRPRATATIAATGPWTRSRSTRSTPRPGGSFRSSTAMGDQDVRRQPAGVRAGYRIGVDRNRQNLVHAAGIRSTGVSSSPALAELVHEVLAAAGAPVHDERRGAVSALEPVPRLLGHPDPAALYARDAAYGEVVCPCEQVTAAEITTAFRMRLAPRSVAGVRKRTHAAAGRCQGTMCLAELARRLAARA